GQDVLTLLSGTVCLHYAHRPDSCLTASRQLGGSNFSLEERGVKARQSEAYLPPVAQPSERSRLSGVGGPSSMKSNSMSFASPKGSLSRRACASSADVTVMRKAGRF